LAADFAAFLAAVAMPPDDFLDPPLRLRRSGSISSMTSRDGQQPLPRAGPWSRSRRPSPSCRRLYDGVLEPVPDILGLSLDGYVPQLPGHLHLTIFSGNQQKRRMLIGDADKNLDYQEMQWMPPCLRAAQMPREYRDEQRDRCGNVACLLDKLDLRLTKA